MTIDNKAFYRNVFSLVLPMALQNLINTAVTSADVIMLGKVGEIALSASSLAGQVQFIMNMFFFGLTSGGAVLTAQYWGKGDIRTIENILGLALRYSLIVGTIFTVGGVCFPEALMGLFSTETEVIRAGAGYLRIVSLSYLLMAVSHIYLNLMRSVERVVISTVVYTTSLLMNIALNAVFIFGLFGLPEMGILGAALGTLIARAIELMITLWYAYCRNKQVRLRFGTIFRKDRLLHKDFLHYSIPVTFNEVVWGAGSAMNTLIIGHMGSPAVAANSVAQVTRQLALVVALGVANAAAIILGKTIGSGQVGLAEIYGKKLVKLTLITGTCGGMAILAALPVMQATMSLSDEAQGYMTLMMCVMCYFSICQSYNTTLVVGVFRAGGDTKFGLFLDTFFMWCFSILLGAICAFILKLPVPVVYIVLMSDEIVKIPVTTWRYRQKKWLRNVTREIPEK
ncbi:MAG: MATE family efflux transporter [Oscillospiraceae bacterium]|nr:MATE family efflux transporter [Oscillospiraceae bacterium]